MAPSRLRGHREDATSSGRWLAVARERPHICFRSRGALGQSLHHHAPFQAAPQARGVAADTLPRPSSHVCDAITLDTYSSVLPNMQESAARAMEDALS